MSAVPAAPATGAANPSPRHRRSQPQPHRQSLRSLDWGGFTHRLFVPAPARPVTRRGVAAAMVAVALGTSVSLLRQPGVGALDTVWAEDGGIFLSDAVGRSTADALTTYHAGYSHLLPRLLAEIASLVPAEQAAAVLAVCAALTTGTIALVIYVASADHLPSRLSRVLVSVVVVVLPLGAEDLGNSIANLHWPGLYLLFWMLIWTPRAWGGRVLATIAVFLVTASDIITVAFVPLVLLRALTRTNLVDSDSGFPPLRPLAARGGRRDRHSLVLGTALGTGLAVQVLGLLLSETSRPLSPNPVQAAAGYLIHAVPSAVIGERWLNDPTGARGLAVAGAAWVLLAAAVVVAWSRMTDPRWPLASIALPYSIALYALPVLLTGVATPRYAAAPAMLLVLAVTALLQPSHGSRNPVPLYAFATLCAVVWLVNLRVDNSRALGPSWREGLRTAAVECAATSADTVKIKISPADAGWYSVLPCSYVQDAQPRSRQQR